MVLFIQAITEPHIPANYLLIMQNHIAFYEAELREQSNCSALTLVKGSRTPQSHHERILQFLFESISSRATKQAKALVTVHNSGRVGKNQAERIHFTQQDFPSGGRVSSDCQ